jgi:signal transduction histidine kinase
MVFSVFDSIRLRSKFLLLGLTLLALIFLPTWFYWREVYRDVVGYELEQRGVPVGQNLLLLVRHLHAHKIVGVVHLQHAKNVQELRKSEVLVKQAFAVLLSIPELRDNTAVRMQLTNLNHEWNILNDLIQRNALTSYIAIYQHNKLMNDLFRLLTQVLDDYRLSLDPDIQGYYLMSSSLIRMPVLLDDIAQAAMFFNIAHAQGALQDSVNKSMSMQLARAVEYSQIVADEINKVLLSDPGMEDKYKKIFYESRDILLSIHGRPVGDFFNSKNSEILNKHQQDFVKLDARLHELTAILLLDLDTSLQERIDNKLNAMYTLLFYVLCLILVIALLSVRFVRGLLTQLGGEPEYALTVVERITNGDLTYPIPPAAAGSLLHQMQAMQYRLNENNQLKSDFVSTVSHELRTPLTAINGVLSLVLHNKLGEIPAAAIKMLEVAQRNCSQLTKLINDLLDIDKLAAGKMELDMRRQYLMPIVDDVVEQMLAYAEKFHVKIVCVKRANSVLVDVDAMRLSQVLTNLLSNAIKFSSADSQVHIAVRLADGKTRISIIDFGEGIPDEFQTKIFQRFSQSDSSSTRVKGGTGLGLAITRELVRICAEILVLPRFTVRAQSSMLSFR